MGGAVWEGRVGGATGCTWEGHVGGSVGATWEGHMGGAAPPPLLAHCTSHDPPTSPPASNSPRSPCCCSPKLLQPLPLSLSCSRSLFSPKALDPGDSDHLSFSITLMSCYLELSPMTLPLSLRHQNLSQNGRQKLREVGFSKTTREVLKGRIRESRGWGPSDSLCTLKYP